jgi:hypothetical protein
MGTMDAVESRRADSVGRGRSAYKEASDHRSKLAPGESAVVDGAEAQPRGRITHAVIRTRLRNKSRIDHQFPQACSGLIAHSRSFQAAVCGARPISALLHTRDLRQILARQATNNRCPKLTGATVQKLSVQAWLPVRNDYSFQPNLPATALLRG